MPPTTYTTYPASTRSHHSTRSRRSMSRSDYSPSHYGGSHHGHGQPGTYAGTGSGSGGRQAYAYEPSPGHYRLGSRSSPQYYYPSTTRPHSRSPTYAYPTNHHDTGRYSTAAQQPAYYVTSDTGHGRPRSTGHIHAHVSSGDH